MKKFRLLSIFLTFSLALIIASLFLPIRDANCISLLKRGSGEEIISLPPNCAQTTTNPDDETAAYFYSQGKQRGLKFKSWIVCQGQVDPKAPIFDFDHDPRWLPSYVPGAYQFRRTVIIIPYANPAPQKSSTIAAVFTVPSLSYISELHGQCDAKFSVWK